MDSILSGTQALLALGTLAAMLVATKITLTYAHRPDGMITTQSYVPTAATDQWGTPLPAPVRPTPTQEKPLWVVWGQLFIVAELAALLIIAILTGGFGVLHVLFGQGG